MRSTNKGFDPKSIKELENQIKNSGRNFLFDKEDERTDEYAHFYFIGMYEGHQVIYDAVMYTLRLHHNSEMYEIAEHKAAIKFPEFKKISYEEDENGDLENLDDLQEEIGLYMAEVIMEMEAEEVVKVKEHVEIDSHIDFGIGLDIGLNVEVITPDEISGFIKKFNDDTLILDETLYSFQDEDNLVIK